MVNIKSKLYPHLTFIVSAANKNFLKGQAYENGVSTKDVRYIRS